MLGTQDDRNALKDYFFSDPNLQTLLDDELKSEFLEYIHNHLSYNQVLIENRNLRTNSENELDRIQAIDMTALPEAEVNRLGALETRYVSRVTRAESALNALETESENLAQNTTNWAKELKETQKKLYSITGLYGINIEDSKRQSFKDARNIRRGVAHLANLKKDITMTDYGNDPEVQNYVTQLFAVVDPTSLQDIDENRRTVAPIIAELTNKLNKYGQATESEVDTDFNNCKAKHEEAESEFQSAYGEIFKYAAAAPDLNGSLQNVFRKFGSDLLSEQHTGFESDGDFQTVLNAYIADETNVNVSARLSSFEVLFRNASQTGNLDDKKAIVNSMKSFKQRVESSKSRAQRKMKSDLQEWYRYTIMGSSLDDPFANEGEFKFYTFGADGKIANNHAIGTYASGGVGFFYSMLDNNYISWLTDGTYTSIQNLKQDVVERHKRASRRFSGPPPKNSKIGVDSVLIWGMYNTVTESHKNDIISELITNWHAITWLDNTATLQDIRRTYDMVSKLGKEIDLDAKHWTTRQKTGYDKMDNLVNEKAGWTYAWVDKARDYASRRLPLFGEPEAMYDVDAISAIEPQWRPELQLLFGGIGALAATYLTGKIIWDIIKSDKPMTDKVGEVVKEIGIATGVGLALDRGRKHSATE